MLKLRIGNREGYSFRIKPGVELGNRREVAPHVIEGELQEFGRVAIMRGRKPRFQLTIIEPSGDFSEIVAREHGSTDDSQAFFVRGGFRVVRSLTGREAVDTFKTFGAD